MMTMKINRVGHWMIPGNHLLRMRLSIALICSRLPPAKTLLFCGLSSVAMLFGTFHRNGLFLKEACGCDQRHVDHDETPQNDCFRPHPGNFNNKISLEHFVIDMEHDIYLMLTGCLQMCFCRIHAMFVCFHHGDGISDFFVMGGYFFSMFTHIHTRHGFLLRFIMSHVHSRHGLLLWFGSV